MFFRPSDHAESFPHSHGQQDPSVGACGVLRGWLSTRVNANPLGNPRQRSIDGVVHADTRSTIG